MFMGKKNIWHDIAFLNSVILSAYSENIITIENTFLIHEINYLSIDLNLMLNWDLVDSNKLSKIISEAEVPIIFYEESYDYKIKHIYYTNKTVSCVFSYDRVYVHFPKFETYKLIKKKVLNFEYYELG